MATSNPSALSTPPGPKELKVVNIHQAKTHLSRLVEEAANGESFVIAKAGKPMVKVTRLNELDESVPKAKRKLGFAEGKWEVPDDFDTIFEKEIEEMFYGEK